jgi:hypothetical protein
LRDGDLIMASREEEIILKFEVDTKDSIKSIDDLTKANKALREERNKLNLQTEEGKKRLHEINTILDHNNKKIRENSSAVEKQRLNIGNYKSALDSVHPALGKVGQGLEAGSKGFLAMARASLAFIATPIGAVLAALVVVFTLLKAALSQNAEFMDKFENITNAVGVVLQVIIGRVGKLGEALVALVSGDFNKAINLTSQAFGGLAEEIGNAVAQQQMFLDLSRELEDAQRALRIESAKQENEIKRLVVAAKNRNLSLDEQETLLRQALALEEELVAKRAENAQKDLVITARRLRANQEFQQQENENFEQYINRLITGGKLSDEEIDGLIDKIEALEQARGSSLAFQEKLENSLAAIQEKRAEALRKQNEALAEQAALERANRRAQNQSTSADRDPLVGAFETRARVITDINKRMNDDNTKRDKEAQLESIRRKREGARIEEEIERSKFATIANFAGATSQLFAEESEAHKVLSTAQAVINTYLAATAALASGSKINPIFGILSAAAAIANGLASVAAINGVQFAEGGFTGPGGKYEPAGIVHKGEYVVPQHVMAKPEAQGLISRLDHMRLRGYADGGFVTNSVSSPVNQQTEFINALKNMPAPILDVRQVTKEQKRVSVKQALSKR